MGFRRALALIRSAEFRRAEQRIEAMLQLADYQPNDAAVPTTVDDQ
jgi:hypothetical protein